MPYFVLFIAPGFTPFYQAKVVVLSRIMLLSPILLGLSNLFGAISQLFTSFYLFSKSCFYNLGIIAGIIFLYPIFGIYGLALGVALGASLHFGIQALSASRSGFVIKFSSSVNFTEVKIWL